MARSRTLKNGERWRREPAKWQMIKDQVKSFRDNGYARQLTSEEFSLEVHDTVDDLVKSVENVGQAFDLIEGLMELLRWGGFCLTKWVLNNKEVL